MTMKYKVGDKVITDTNMKGKIIEVVEEGWYRVEFEPHNGIPQPNGVIPEESMSLVEEEIKPKFKVGDILFYRGETCGYLKVEEIREENGEIRYYETSRNIYLVENDPDVFADKVCSVETEETKSEDELLDDYEELTDRAFKGGYEKCKSDIELNGFQLPEGYIFKDDNGNVINAQKIVLEKKTVEEKYSDVKIQIFGNVVILKGGINADNPTEYMNEVVHYIVKLLGNPKHNQFIEEFLDNPWVRILVFDFNSMEFNNSFDDIVTNFKQ